MQAKNPRALLGRLAADWSGWSVAACVVLLCAVPLAVHVHKYPDFAGFFAGVDQQRYLMAARAWAAGDLNPADHHYLPFYPLMGAAFAWLTPWQPFMLPDLACLLASLAIFLRIGRRLAPDWRAGAVTACFVLGVLGGRSVVAVWVVPWSTTGSAPFQFLAVLLALRMGEAPTARRAALFTLVAALVAGFRPSDAAVLLAGGGVFCAWALVQAGSGPRAWLGCGAGAALGMVAGLLPVVAAHAAVFGLSLGPYVRESASIGLEWRLLALRWVMVVVGPRPLLPGGVGLAAGLPWVAAGIVGMILGGMRAQGRRASVFVAGIVALHWAVYLMYRDLQPAALWRFYNIHYFKWTFPFLALWAARWAAALTAPASRRQALVAAAASVPLFLWQPVLRDPAPLPVALDGSTVRFTAPAFAPGLAIRLPLRGGWEAVYFGKYNATLGGQALANKGDYRMQPVADAALLLPLRRLPAGEVVFNLPDGVSFDARQAAETLRQGVVFGLPFLLPGH
jgi:hypothetical protein